MFNKLASSIVSRMERNAEIPPGDREIYLFGVWQGLFMLLNIATMILIGLISGAFLYVLVFALAYIPLRSFAGGYHAKTQVRCYIASIIMMVFVARASIILPLDSLLVAALLIVFSVLIIALAPVGNANKPLDDLEIKAYKTKVTKICVAEVLFALIFLSLGTLVVFIGVFWSLAIVLALLVLEKLFGQRIKKTILTEEPQSNP